MKNIKRTVHRNSVKKAFVNGVVLSYALGVNFINILRAQYSYKSVSRSFSLVKFWLYNFWHMYKKCACKTLMKLTAGKKTMPGGDELKPNLTKIQPIVTWSKKIVTSYKLTNLFFSFSTSTSLHCEIKGRFHQHFTISFCTRRSQKQKKTLMTWLSFCTFGIFSQKSCI